MDDAPRTLDHFPAEHFARIDPRPDAEFYDFPRLVVPIDDGAIAAVRRTLRPGGIYLVTFSNRCFPTKAVRIWYAGDDADHLALVQRYFERSGGWTDPETAAHLPRAGDPLYAVWARRL